METLLAAFCVLCAIVAAPAAAGDLRLQKRLKYETEEAELVLAAIANAPSAEELAAADRLAATARISTFGDQRRRTAHTAELIRVETGPIHLPNEHVPVEA